MRRAVRFALALVALGSAGRAWAAQADLTRLLTHEGDIETLEPVDGDPAEERLLRLVLPPQVIAASRADLSDVRIFNGRGEVVPFVVDSGLRAGEVRQATQSLEVKVLEARREALTFEGEPTIYHEEYDIEAPEAVPGSRWEIVLDSERPDFIRSLDVSALADGEELPLLRDATVFRLRAMGAERTAIVLPAFRAQRLRVAIEGAEGAYLAPRLRLRSTATFDGGERAVLPLEILSQTKENGRTSIEVARPHGIVPDVLRLETTTPAFYRSVEVFDVRQGDGAERIGGGAVFRVKLRKNIGHSEVRLAGAHGERLRIEVGDEDSPPLRDLKVFAEVRRPALYFHLPVRGRLTGGMLRYGGGRVERPRYDLEQLAPVDGMRGRPAALAALLLDRSQSIAAEALDLRANPDFDPAPLLAFAMQPGAGVDAAGFSHRRSVHVEESPDGLARLRLQPQDLAIARADVGDLRVVDDGGRQWPYLLDRGAGGGQVDVAIAELERDQGVTHYRMKLPYGPLSLDSLQLTTEPTFFRRRFRLLGRDEEGRERTLAEGQLDASPTHALPPLALDGTRVDGLDLYVVDGDEAPIQFRGARAGVRVPDLYLVAPPGDYTLLIGNREAAPPRYDLGDVREAVLAVSSAPASAGSLEANPGRDWRHRLLGGDRRMLQGAAVWTVLVAAVLALALVTLRLVRREPPAG